MVDWRVMFKAHREVNEMNGKWVSRRGKPGSRLSARSTASVLAVVVLGVGVAALGAVSTSADSPKGHGPTAHAARTIWVHEIVHGTNVSHQGNTVINDRGMGKGTFNCLTEMHMRIYYTKGFTSINCKTRSGEVEAAGKVAFFSAGATATFTGTIPITHGTGKYAHGSGHYRVEGTVVRKTYAVEASTSGWFTY
jgi:hypothetical protein